MKIAHILLLFLLFACGWWVSSLISAKAETVSVKYRGLVDLEPFSCTSTPRSSVINRICYDADEEYVVVKVGGTYYHYCEVPPQVHSDWLNAQSLGKYYIAHVKGRYDCRMLHVPQYSKGKK